MNQNIDSLLKLSIQSFKSGNFKESKLSFLKILETKPKNFEALLSVGVILGIEKNYNSAIEYFQKAIKINPNNYLVNYNLALVFAELDNHTEAIKHYSTATKINPNHLISWINSGKILLILKKYDEAITHYDQVIRLKPDYLEAWVNKGISLNNLKRYDEALFCYDHAIKLKSDYAELWSNKSIALDNLNRYEESIFCCDQAIKLSPDYVEALVNKAVSLNNLKRYDEALYCCDQAIKLKIDYAEAWSSKGISLNNLRHYEQALSCFDQAIKLRSDYAEAWSNKGFSLDKLKRHDEALSCCDQAIKLRPDYYDSYWNKSLIKLVIGDFENGWELYKYRWQKGDAYQYRHFNIKKLELLSNLKDKKILIWYEQGFGDTIQFSRFIPKLINLGAIVTFEVQKDLEVFFKNQFECEITSKVNVTDHFDFQAPLLDLVRLFKTSIDNIPSNHDYLKVQYKVVDWKKKLKLSKNKLNVGISISGSSNYKDNFIRSLPLKNIEPLIQAANFFVIQKELSDKDINFLRKYPEIHFLGREIVNFSDTAAIVENMDLIISIDSSLIHLAGALGKKSFLMLPWIPEWRWMLDRSDSPWYQSIKIFRQKSIGDWDSVIREIKLELASLNKKI
jgi:tetratricopeptide (TPR) repeat protein